MKEIKLWLLLILVCLLLACSKRQTNDPIQSEISMEPTQLVKKQPSQSISNVTIIPTSIPTLSLIPLIPTLTPTLIPTQTTAPTAIPTDIPSNSPTETETNDSTYKRHETNYYVISNTIYTHSGLSQGCFQSDYADDTEMTLGRVIILDENYQIVKELEGYATLEYVQTIKGSSLLPMCRYDSANATTSNPNCLGGYNIENGEFTIPFEYYDIKSNGDYYILMKQPDITDWELEYQFVIKDLKQMSTSKCYDINKNDDFYWITKDDGKIEIYNEKLELQTSINKDDRNSYYANGSVRITANELITAIGNQLIGKELTNLSMNDYYVKMPSYWPETYQFYYIEVDPEGTGDSHAINGYLLDSKLNVVATYYKHIENLLIKDGYIEIDNDDGDNRYFDFDTKVTDFITYSVMGSGYYNDMEVMEVRDGTKACIVRYDNQIDTDYFYVIDEKNQVVVYKECGEYETMYFLNDKIIVWQNGTIYFYDYNSNEYILLSLLESKL